MIFEALLRGNNFRPIEAKAYYNAMKQGQPLLLRRDPDNQYDPNAIQVCNPEGDNFIGFVAKEVACDLAPHMDEGTEFKCHASMKYDAKTWMLNIRTADEGEFSIGMEQALSQAESTGNDEIPF